MYRSTTPPAEDVDLPPPYTKLPQQPDSPRLKGDVDDSLKLLTRHFAGLFIAESDELAALFNERLKLDLQCQNAVESAQAPQCLQQSPLQEAPTASAPAPAPAAVTGEVTHSPNAADIVLARAQRQRARIKSDLDRMWRGDHLKISSEMHPGQKEAFFVRLGKNDAAIEIFPPDTRGHGVEARKLTRRLLSALHFPVLLPASLTYFPFPFSRCRQQLKQHY